MKRIVIGKSVIICSDQTARDHFPYNDIDNLHSKGVVEKIANDIKIKLDNEVPNWKAVYDKICEKYENERNK